MKLKVCGMKYGQNISELARVKPDYMGFIFYERSPRAADDETKLSHSSITNVGVFVNSSLADIKKRVKTHDLGAIQLHGQESPQFCMDLRTEIGADIKLIKVFSIRDEFDFTSLEPYEEVVDFFLFDTKGELPGGNGFTFDWSVLKDYPSEKPFFLSGGIEPGSVGKIKSFLETETANRCYAIDINSGFEIKPGLKDIKKIKIFKEKL